MDSNRGPLVSEATALPTEPQPLPIDSTSYVASCRKKSSKLRLVHTSRRSLQLSQRARPLQVAAKIWKIFYLATVYRRSQQIRSVVWTSLYKIGHCNQFTFTNKTAQLFLWENLTNLYSILVVHWVEVHRLPLQFGLKFYKTRLGCHTLGSSGSHFSTSITKFILVYKNNWLIIWRITQNDKSLDRSPI